MIQFNNVSKRYSAGHEALVNVNFSLEKGEMAFLTGHSGAGKSTLLRLIPRIETPSFGQVLVNGQNLTSLAPRHVPQLRRHIGMIFQDYRLLMDRSVFDNVALPMVISGTYDQREIGRRVRAALDKVGLLDREKDLPPTLSGGEQQRVGIARAVVNRPILLIADEPTGNLDPDLSREIMHLFEQFNRVGVTVLVATHDVKLIGEMNGRVLHLEHGTLIEGEHALQ